MATTDSASRRASGDRSTAASTDAGATPDGKPPPDAHGGPPLRGYATLMVTFNVAFGCFVMSAARRGGELPGRLSAGELLFFATATQKLSRLITKERATSVLRAPFTDLAASGDGEVEERPRGTGLQRALGELVTCPYCVSLWITGAFMAGRVFRPRETGLVAGTFSTLFVSDALQLAHKVARNRADQL